MMTNRRINIPNGSPMLGCVQGAIALILTLAFIYAVGDATFNVIAYFGHQPNWRPSWSLFAVYITIVVVSAGFYVVRQYNNKRRKGQDK